jgi:hypothetical protein
MLKSESTTAATGYWLRRLEPTLVTRWVHASVAHWVGWTAVCAAVGDPDGKQLGHCDVGTMLGPQVGAALGADVGDALGALVGAVLGRLDGSGVGLAEGEHDGLHVGAAVGDSDGEQLGHCDE